MTQSGHSPIANRAIFTSSVPGTVNSLTRPPPALDAGRALDHFLRSAQVREAGHLNLRKGEPLRVDQDAPEVYVQALPLGHRSLSIREDLDRPNPGAVH